MKLGNYRDKITLQRPTFTQNAIGERVPAWETVASPFASVLPIRQTEAPRDQGQATVTTYSIRMHYRADVAATWRAIYSGKVLQFQSVYDPTNRRLELEAVAIETGGQ